MYTVDYFIAKFHAIPEENWYEGNYNNTERTAFCALGHCGSGSSRTGLLEVTKEAVALQRIIRTYLESEVTSINDGLSNSYNQETPKQRVLAALMDIRSLVSFYQRRLSVEISDPPITAEELISSLPAIEELQFA